MARHVIAPDDVPSWAAFAYGRVGLPLGHELALVIPSIDSPLNAIDLALIASQEAPGVDPDGNTVIDYLKVIYDGLKAYWEAP